MRIYATILLGAWLGSAALSAACNTWVAQDGALARLGTGTQADVALPGDARTLDGSSDGGAWLTTGDHLWSVSPDGQLRAHADLVASGLGNSVDSAPDADDGSVWIATDASLLLHFASDGSLERGTTLPAPASAMAVDLDHSVWVVSAGQLMHFARSGAWLETRETGVASDRTVIALAVDALRDRVWLATSGGVFRVGARAGALPSPLESISGEVSALALDPRSGGILAIADESLLALDGDGHPNARFEQALPRNERPLAVFYDADDGSFVVKTARSVVRIGPDGRALATYPASADAMVGTTPFRIAPTLTLLRPPDGGAVADARAEIILGVSAACNSAPCDVGAAYRASVRIDAALDAIPLGEATVDSASGRATFPKRLPLRPGLNRLTASVIDRFGHRATLDRDARLMLLDPATEGAAPAVSRGTAEPTNDARTAKAANKSPTVALTAPVTGTTFTTGTNIALTASANDPDGTIAKVEFYRGGATLLGTATSPPYGYVWPNVGPGTYSLTAKAYDNRNGTATSAPAAIVVTSNQLPVVVVTSPVGGSFLLAGSSVTLSATATDPDGSIAGVEFFDGAVSIGLATAPPYGVAWSSSVAGPHSIVARATDDKGGTRDSAPVDIVVGEPPVVVVTAPAACSEIEGPLDLSLAADAISMSGTIASVEFFDGGASVGVAYAHPWRATLANASTGSHSVTARATDDRGFAATSRPALFTVRALNVPPGVAIASPVEGARFAQGSALNLTATAADTDGVVTSVEYRLDGAGGALIGSATNPPYAVAWSGMPPGSYALVAIAHDDGGASTTSPTVHIVIDANALPSIVLTAPTANATFAAPATIAMSASASDGDGTIAKVEFYADSTLVATATAAPYAASWTNVGAGAYSITAKATDNQGGVATSTPVSIAVVGNAPPTIALANPAANGAYFTPATIPLSANAADSDGAIASVEFYANGLPIGAAVTAPYAVVWDGVAAGTYTLTAKAIDNQGGATTSSPASVVVGAPAINIVAALDGATIDDDNVLVQGYVLAPSNSAVTVNGVVTHIDDSGRFQANDVPLQPGQNVVTALVATQDGLTMSHTISIESTGRGPFVVHASPTEGLESLEVTFTVENPSGTTFREIDFDLDGDGLPNVVATPDQFVDGLLTVTATYPVGTWVAVVKVYDDQDHILYSTSKAIVVLSPAALQRSLRAVYDGMLARLRVGNIPGALSAFTGAAYERYNAIFTQLQPSLASIVDQLGQVREVTFGTDLAEFSIVRDGPDGSKRFLLYMIRAEDGIWRIDGM